MRLLGFLIALLLLAGTVDPTQGWLITLVVVTGLAFVRPRPWDLFRLRPAFDVRLAAFVFATLLLAGAIDPTRDWLIGLTIVTGIAAVCPRIIAVDPFGHERRKRPRTRDFWSSAWWDYDEWWSWSRDGERRGSTASLGAPRTASFDASGEDWP